MGTVPHVSGTALSIAGWPAVCQGERRVLCYRSEIVSGIRVQRKCPHMEASIMLNGNEQKRLLVLNAVVAGQSTVAEAVASLCRPVPATRARQPRMPTGACDIARRCDARDRSAPATRSASPAAAPRPDRAAGGAPPPRSSRSPPPMLPAPLAAGAPGRRAARRATPQPPPVR